MDSGENKKARNLICLTLIIATFAVYWRVGGFDFVNYDDPDYITENRAVNGGLTLNGIVWAFTRFHAGNWHPVTWLSHMLDCQIFGLHPGAHHWVNVIFHAANAALLFLLLLRLTGAHWRSAIVAALFALHPLHVESVAWISERKDVLSTFFGLLALLAYVTYVSQLNADAISDSAPQGTPKSKCSFVLGLIFFALSLMSKPMLVTLPFVMLLLDVWPLRRLEFPNLRSLVYPPFGKLIAEKKLWFGFSAASCVITFFAQKSGGAIMTAQHFPFTARLANAIASYLAYVLKTFCPVDLAVFYPLQPHPLWFVAAAAVFVVIISLVALYSMKRFPPLLVGWLWFLGTLVPVIGLVQVGSQAMADRYTYFPLIGIFIAIVWGVGELLRRVHAPSIIGGTAAAGALGLLAFLTVFQLQYWQNSLTLFTYTLAVTRDNATAHNNLGTALAAIGQADKALDQYTEAVRIAPDNPRFQDNLATALLRAGQRDSAVEHYLDAIHADPKYAQAYSNLGTIFLRERRLDEALTNLNEAVRLEPQNAELRNNLANGLLGAGKLDDAVGQYLIAVRLDPFDATVRLNTGLALLKAHRPGEATAQFSEAVRLNPKSAAARYEFGRQLFLQGRFLEALNQLKEAVSLRPNYAIAQLHEAAVLGELGNFDDATAIANQALESARTTGQTNLIPRIQTSLEAFKARKPYRPGSPKGN